jgi:hypothetical protein
MNRTSTRYFGSTLVALALCASARGAVWSESKNDRKATPTCGAIQILAPEAASTRHRRSRRSAAFSAAEILDLELQVSVPRVSHGDHEVALYVYTPKGHLYQTLRAHIGSPETRARREGVRASSRARMARATLPVAGTSIVTSSLYGEWRIEAHLDGADGVCSRPRTVIIKP